MNIKTFAMVLKSKKIPFYAVPRYHKRKDVFDFYRFSTITKERVINQGSNRKKEIVRISSEIQKEIFESLIKVDFKTPFIIGVSSPINDLLATELCGCLLFNILKYNNKDINWIWGWNNKIWFNKIINEMEDYPDLVIISNNIPDTERVYSLRDILHYYNNSIRIVINSSINSLSFMDDYVKFPLSGILHVVGINQKMCKDRIFHSSDSKSDYSYPSFIGIEKLFKINK